MLQSAVRSAFEEEDSSSSSSSSAFASRARPGGAGRGHPRPMVWAWLAPPRLARLVRGVGGAHQNGVLYGGAAAACAVAAGSLYYADHVERSQNNLLAEELNANEKRRGRRFHTVVPACHSRQSPFYPWLAWGAGVHPTPPTPRLLGPPSSSRSPRAVWPVPRCADRAQAAPGAATRPSPNPDQVVPGA